jgi:hypothetical protein
LGQHGVDAWFDVHRVRPGDEWDDVIVDAVRAADCVVLVASREAIASPHVSAELGLAHELGTPVVVAFAERVQLPPGLADAPRIDLLRGFEANVRMLAAALRASDLTPLSRRVLPAGWRSRAHPVVYVLCGALLLGGLLCAAGAVYYRLSPGSEQFATSAPLGNLLISAMCVWLCWMLARRRAGTMLALRIAFAFAAILATLAGGALLYSVTAPPGVGWTRTITVLGVLCVLAAPFVAGVMIARSRPLYRWLATGDAPQRMRTRMLARRGHHLSTPTLHQTATVTYDLRCHELDIAVERALDRALQASGHRRGDAAQADRTIVVLSNLTPRDWLDHALATRDGHVIAVIAAPIALRVLERIEGYQWVDYRRHQPRTLDRLAASIAHAPRDNDAQLVPERLARRVIPASVFALSGLYLYSAAGAFAYLIVALADPAVLTKYGGPSSPLPALALALIGAPLLIAIAAAIRARRIPLRYVLAFVVVNVPATAALGTLLYPDLPVATRLQGSLSGRSYSRSAGARLLAGCPHAPCGQAPARLPKQPPYGGERPPHACSC